jgi:hypothetical protein
VGEYSEEAMIMKQCSKTGMLTILVAMAVLLAATVAISATVKKSGSFYDVKVVTSGSADAMVATITTTGKIGYHCNMLYPWKLTIEPGDGLTVAKPKMKKEDAAQFTEAGVVFKVPYTATESATTVNAALKLSLCDDKQCQMETVALSWPAR